MAAPDRESSSDSFEQAMSDFGLTDEEKRQARPLYPLLNIEAGPDAEPNVDAIVEYIESISNIVVREKLTDMMTGVLHTINA